MKAPKPYLIGGALGFLALSAWFVKMVLASTSSTASIALIFTPFAGSAGAMAAVFAVFLVRLAMDIARGKEPLFGWKTILSLSAILAGSIFIALWARETRLRKAAISASAGEVREIYHGTYLLRRSGILEGIAMNPNTPPELLEELADGPNGVALLNVIGSNAAAPPALVEKILSGEKSYTRVAGIALHPKLSAEQMARLVRVKREDFPGEVEFNLYQTYVIADLVRREDFPEALFREAAAIEAPAFFLANALLNSPFADCALVKRLGDSSEATIRNAAEQRGQALRCTR